MISLKINREDLLSILQKYKSLIYLNGLKLANQEVLIFEIRKNKCYVSVTGVEKEVNAKIEGIGIFSVNFIKFLRYIQNLKHEELSINVDKKKLKILKSSFPIIYFESLINRKLNLPVNYNLRQLLAVKKFYSFYSKDEMELWNIDNKIIIVEELLIKDIEKIYSILKRYNINIKEVRDVVEKEVYRHHVDLTFKYLRKIHKKHKQNGYIN